MKRVILLMMGVVVFGCSGSDSGGAIGNSPDAAEIVSALGCKYPKEASSARLAEVGASEVGITAGSSCTLGKAQLQVYTGSNINGDAYKEARRSYLACDVPVMSEFAWAAGDGWIVDVSVMDPPSETAEAAEDVVDKLGTGAAETVAC